MGISLESEHWGCLRDPSHRGRKPYYLVAALLGVSVPQARLVVAQYEQADPDSLFTVGAISDPQKPDKRPEVDLSEFDTFRTITRHGLSRKCWEYLSRRGFDKPDHLIESYDLRWCSTGRWKDRIIVPIYENHELIGWTGRALMPRPKVAPRYLSTGSAIKDTVFNHDELTQGGKLLFVLEGPFDALKVDYYGRELGAYATCLFGTELTAAQAGVLSVIIPKFKQVVVIMDPEAVGPSFVVSEWLAAPNVINGHLPLKAEDPGSLTAKQVKFLVSQYGGKL